MTSIPNELSLRRPTWAEIDLNALQNNFRRITKCVAPARVIGVVKSDAYGHGAVTIARELQGAGISLFGTATVEEAIQLRAAGIHLPIVVLSGITPSQFPLLLVHDFTPVVFHPRGFEELAAFAESRQKKIVVHLKIDTGMHRLGVSPEEAERLIAQPARYVEIGGVYTHFATADIPDDANATRQLAVFQAFVKRHENRFRCVHAANSAAILNYPGARFDFVRPGLLLYGISPSPEPSDYEPILSLKSRIIHLQSIKKDEGIGYGFTFRAGRDSVIATLPVGYNDGLRRRLSNRLQIELHGRRCKIAGEISMDLCMIDVTDVADKVKLYDEVVLLGSWPAAWDWAKLLETIPYEITCLIGSRIPRVYLKNGSIADIYYP